MRIRKLPIRILICFAAAIIVGGILTELQERNAADYPAGKPADLTELQFPLQQQDYALVKAETGLMPLLIDEIIAKEQQPLGVLTQYQQYFRQQPKFTCNGIAEISSAERIRGRENYYPFYDLRPGDVLLTKSTHTLFYRHGHSGLIIDEDTLLEAAEIGMSASHCDPAAWGGYPTVMQLRIKEEVAAKCGMTGAELGKAVAAYAEQELLGDDYSLLCGCGDIGFKTDQTQCAYLIWEAFRHFGIDASARKFPVTPKSLWASGVFDIICYRGFSSETTTLSQ